MEIVAKNIQPLLELDKVEKELFGVQLTEAQRKDRAFGRPIFLENMQVQDSVLDGKVQLYLDRSGTLQNQIDFKRNELVVPKSLLGHELSEEELSRLSHGQEISVNLKGKNFFVKIDHELNNIVIRAEKLLASVPEIGGYKLSSQEQNALFAGERLSPKIYKGEQGYFMAHVELDADKKGLVFSNIKEVSPEQATDLIKKYNQPETSLAYTKIISQKSVSKDKSQGLTSSPEKGVSKAKSSKAVKPLRVTSDFSR